MINNEMREIYLITYKDEVDDYGQSMVGKKKKQSIQMFLKPFSHTANENPSYVDIELIGLTKEDISIDNRIEIGNDTYSISNPAIKGRMNMYYLKRI